MPRRQVTTDGCAEIERIAMERYKLPTDVELAQKHRVSRRRVQQIMKHVRDRFSNCDQLPQSKKIVA